MMKVAIVEDDQAIAAMYQMKFEAEGFKVETATNGKLGLAKIAETKPDIVLLDLMMPVMSGDEMLVKLRQTDYGKSLPVVVLTNVSDSDAPKVLKELGVSRYIVKAHVTPLEIVTIVRETLASKTQK